jgi:transcriptional regulator with XRE-family HTH domain
MTQEAVAFEAGISTTYLSDVERGRRNVAVVNLVRIAEALSTTAGDILAAATL